MKGFECVFDTLDATNVDGRPGYVIGELADQVIDALRAACGGGPVVILEDGTLATLKFSNSVVLFGGGQGDAFCVVPVGES